MGIIEVEVCGPNAEQLFFAPVSRPLRGRIDFAMLKNKSAHDMRQNWPDPIPGKIIGINPDTGERYIRDGLHDKDGLKVRQQIVANGMTLPAEEKEVFQSGDVTTWLYWLRRAVDAGHARILIGTLPERSTFPGESVARKSDGRPQKDFLFAQTEPPADKSAEALASVVAVVEQNTKVMTALLAKLSAAK